MNPVSAWHVKLPVQYLREGETVVAVCSVLDVSAYGKTLPEAQANLHSAFQAFFEEAAAHGTLDELFQEHGWQRQHVEHRPPWSPPVMLSPSDYEEVTVPVPVA